MAGYGDSGARGPLLRALEDPDLEVRREAAVSAGRVQLRDAVPLPQEWLDDPAPDLRSVAATAPADLGPPRLIPDLLRAPAPQTLTLLPSSPTPHPPITPLPPHPPPPHPPPHPPPTPAPSHTHPLPHTHTRPHTHSHTHALTHSHTHALTRSVSPLWRSRTS